MAGIIQFDDTAGDELFVQYHEVNVLRLYLVEIRFVLRVSLHWFKQIEQSHLGKRIAADFIGDCFDLLESILFVVGQKPFLLVGSGDGQRGIRIR